MKTEAYHSPLPRSVNEYVLRAGIQSTEHFNYTRNVPGALRPHIDRLASGEVEGIVFLSRVPPKLHQAISEAITEAVKAWAKND